MANSAKFEVKVDSLSAIFWWETRLRAHSVLAIVTAKVVFFSFFLSFIFLGESPRVALAISIVCRFYKRISNGFKTHCHKRISGAFRRWSEIPFKSLSGDAFLIFAVVLLVACPDEPAARPDASRSSKTQRGPSFSSITMPA